MSESAFLERIFKISALPSHDSRAKTMESDVSLHRGAFYDWGGPEWVHGDARLDLMGCPDAKLLEFLALMVHPLVRPDQDAVDQIVILGNAFVSQDGYHLAVVDEVSGKRIFAAIPTVVQHGSGTEDAARVADEMASAHVARQVARMKASLMTDPALAIGSAKEFLESVARWVLREHDVTLTGGEAMPLLVKMARDKLDLGAETCARCKGKKTVYYARLASGAEPVGGKRVPCPDCGGKGKLGARRRGRPVTVTR